MIERRAKPRTLSEEEIELYLAGDKRQVDKLILQSLNIMAAAYADHIAKEEPVLEALGDPAELSEERAWVRAQIDRQTSRNAMMRKVAESSLSWALIGFLGFLGFALWDHFVDLIHTHLGSGGRK